MNKEEKIQAYIEKISRKHGLSLEDARNLEMVKEYIKNVEGDYEQVESDSISTNDTPSINCS